MLLDHTPPAADLTKLDPHLVAFVRPRSFEAEQYRRLRQRIEDLAPERGLRVIGVTSAAAGDGKTLTAINLAAVLARAPGAHILLIDADLRRPSVRQRVGLDATTPSWTDGLEERADNVLDRAVNITTGLDVLVATESRTDAYEVLRSAPFLALVAAARRRYDYVIVDTPPSVPVADSALLNKAVDGFLLVVAASVTPRALVREALGQFEAGAVIGIVFNRDPHPLLGYGSRRYFRSYVRALEGD
jgi:non-specific protein-tyrosine kinase